MDRVNSQQLKVGWVASNHATNGMGACTQKSFPSAIPLLRDPQVSLVPLLSAAQFEIQSQEVTSFIQVSFCLLTHMFLLPQQSHKVTNCPDFHDSAFAILYSPLWSHCLHLDLSSRHPWRSCASNGLPHGTHCRLIYSSSTFVFHFKATTLNWLQKVLL